MGKRKGSLARSSSKLKKEKKREKEKKKEKLKQKDREKGKVDREMDGVDSSNNNVFDTIDFVATTAIESSSPAFTAGVAVSSKGNEAAAKVKPKAPAFAGPAVPRIVCSFPGPAMTITPNLAGKESATEVKPKLSAFAGPAMPRLSLHKKGSSLGNISEEDLQLRLTQSLDEIKLRSNYVPVITLTKCDENNIQATRAGSPSASLRSIEFSLKTRKQSYARRSILHRFSSVSDGVWSVLETTANAARNTLKVPPMWEWKGTSPSKDRLGKYSGKKPLLHTEDDDDGSFPYAGDWKTGARYRYYHRTAPVGSGFVAVGRREDDMELNKQIGIFSADIAKLARRKRLSQGLLVTNPGDKADSDGNILPRAKVGPALASLASITKTVPMEEEEVSEAELERLLGSYGDF